MGLDQYLTARRYIGAWGHDREEEKELYSKICRASGVPDWKCHGSPYLLVEISVAYWRKANQIHRWFVENVQDGVDDCRDYGVSKEQLLELRGLCNQVVIGSKLISGKVKNGQVATKGGEFKDVLEEGRIVENPALAQEILPNSEGFFFGSCEYDQYYIESLKDTIDQLDRVFRRFKEEDGWDFRYTASW